MISKIFDCRKFVLICWELRISCDLNQIGIETDISYKSLFSILALQFQQFETYIEMCDVVCNFMESLNAKSYDQYETFISAVKPSLFKWVWKWAIIKLKTKHYFKSRLFLSSKYNELLVWYVNFVNVIVYPATSKSFWLLFPLNLLQQKVSEISTTTSA